MNSEFSYLTEFDQGQNNAFLDNTFRSKQTQWKVDTRPFQGQLPFQNTAFAYNIDAIRNEPIVTKYKGQKVIFNDALHESGPFYLRQWPIWDNFPILPTCGDVTLDPRYSIQTNIKSGQYKQLK